MKHELKNTLISTIIFILWIGGGYFIWNNFHSLILRILLLVFFSIVMLITTVYSATSHKKCPFHNDRRLLNAQGLSWDVFYKNQNFCSASDSIEPYYEVFDGLQRAVSATNKYMSCCLEGGEGCPIFQKFKNLSKKELINIYKNRH